MKPSLNTFVLLPLLALLALAPAHQLAAAEREASIEVLVVRASNGEGGVDSALRGYASNLQRLFRFGSYQQEGRKEVRVKVPGEQRVGLGRDQSLQLRVSPDEGSSLRADVKWQRGDKTLLHTRIQLNPGSPAILGGPRSRDGTHLLILRLR
jgi:hypothetical protein